MQIKLFIIISIQKFYNYIAKRKTMAHHGGRCYCYRKDKDQNVTVNKTCSGCEQCYQLCDGCHKRFYAVEMKLYLSRISYQKSLCKECFPENEKKEKLLEESDWTLNY